MIEKEVMNMKKWICILLTALLIPVLASCGSTKTEEKTESKPEEKTETIEWTRAGYFQDENENMISITWMDDIDEPAESFWLRPETGQSASASAP